MQPLVCDTGLGVVSTGKVEGPSTCTLPSSRTPSGLCERIGGHPVSVGCNRAVGRLICLAPTTDVIRSPILRRGNLTPDSEAVSGSSSISGSSGAPDADAQPSAHLYSPQPASSPPRGPVHLQRPRGGSPPMSPATSMKLPGSSTAPNATSLASVSNLKASPTRGIPRVAACKTRLPPSAPPSKPDSKQTAASGRGVASRVGLLLNN